MQDIRRRGDGAQIDEFHSVLRSKRSSNILLGDEALIDQLPYDASCSGPRASMLDLVPSQKSNLPEYFDDKFFVVRHDVWEVIVHDYGRALEGQWQLSLLAR